MYDDKLPYVALDGDGGIEGSLPLRVVSKGIPSL
jgi:hypothetical protein